MLPQKPVYHFHTEFVPKTPPVSDNVAEFPEHIFAGDTVIEIGIVERVFTMIVVLTQVVVLQTLSALT